ncbi:uncharacterized protein LOC131066725 [Cryptomeria japonica]|uniref:uncharacterized protein LOC131066725 n=1 Tax=Cryptomeria japonica TaxID=3369 RepID=UPI0027DA7699|nr:uncharacterized protein LOC131066725 [Cryptomeria japonica]
MGKQNRSMERRQRRYKEIAEARAIPYSEADRWWSTDTLAVVTGSNRGIGFEIVQQLAKHGLAVVLTSRDSDKGQEVVASLQKQGLNVVFHQLDIVDTNSVNQFAKWVEENFGGIDILVNNAGANFNTGSSNSVEHAQTVIYTNYYGSKRMIESMLPLMRSSASGARILNVGSRLGRINGRRNKIGDELLRNQLEDEEHLTEELIDNTVERFLEQVKEGTWISGGWPQNFTDYSVSKLAVNSYTRLLSRRLSDRPAGSKIYANCYCPGWVKTDMTGGEGIATADEGADTGVWTVLLPPESPTGKFFAERREIRY